MALGISNKCFQVSSTVYILALFCMYKKLSALYPLSSVQQLLHDLVLQLLHGLLALWFLGLTACGLYIFGFIVPHLVFFLAIKGITLLPFFNFLFHTDMKFQIDSDYRRFWHYSKQTCFIVVQLYV